MFGFGLRLGNLRRSSNVSSFVGILDGYSSGLAGAWSVAYKLITNYSGPLVRIRRASDNAELDINALSNGLLDVASLNAFVGGSNWFIRTVYNQQGTSGINLNQSSALSQPQGAVGTDGIPYAYAPNPGFTTTNLMTSGISQSYTSNTIWSVGQGGSAGTIDITARNQTGDERRKAIGPSQIRNNIGGTGTNGTISGTSLARYVFTQQVNESGNRISNGITSNTGTKIAGSSATSFFFSVGYGGGGVSWMQNAQWLASAFWVNDLGNSNVDALNASSRALFNTL